MIVHTMSEKEIFNELNTDMLSLLKFSDKMDSKYRRSVLKASRFPVYRQTFYTSPKNNKWILFFEARNKKEVGDESRLTFVTYVDSPHGFMVVMSSSLNGKRHLIFYPPHFFTRYRERLNIDLIGLDLIRNFFKYNSSYTFEFKDNEFNTEVFGSTKEGVALGVVSEENNVLFKTFITYKMTKGEQVESFAKNEAIRQKIHENE